MTLTLCYVLFGAGLLIFGAGMMLREKIPPRAAAALVLIGVITAMFFMNMALFMSMGRIM